MNFTVTQDDNGTYHLEGELTVHDLDHVRDFLDGSLQGGKAQRVDISMAKVQFIDTAVLQLFIAFKKWVSPGVKFQISSLSGDVEEILSLCGLKRALL